MKRKALVYGAVSAVLITATAVSLSACNGSAARVKSDEVSKETWQSALDSDNFNNYAMEVVITTEKKDDSGAQGAVTMHYTLSFETSQTQFKAHIKGKESYEGAAVLNGVKSRKVEYYLNNSATDYIYKTKKGWKTAKSSEDYASLGSIVGFMGELLIAERLVKEYDSFKYDKASKGYIRRIAEASENTVVKFKKDKLKAIVNEVAYGNDLKANIQIVYTFGGQSITIPELS